MTGSCGGIRVYNLPVDSWTLRQSSRVGSKHAGHGMRRQVCHRDNGGQKNRGQDAGD